VGLAQTWVVLKADHASMPLVELAQKRGLPARRFRSDAVEGGEAGAGEDFQALGAIANTIAEFYQVKRRSVRRV
jgi:hypothetical protein